jgi:two-component system phosphate regulon response regulator PhoB
MEQANTVLVVEDEADIRNLVAINLRRAGFEVLTAEDGTQGLSLALQQHPPVVVLDLMLPDMSGYEICAQIRASKEMAHTHVLMLTARTEEDDKIAGFQAGADDYVTKPFSVRELVLRVQAAARRATREQKGTPDAKAVERGKLKIDPAAHRVWVDNQEVILTATEFRLVMYLASHPGKLCSRGELLQEVWELPPHLNTRTVDTHIKRLRHKMGAGADYVETVRGAGYRFSEAS